MRFYGGMTQDQIGRARDRQVRTDSRTMGRSRRRPGGTSPWLSGGSRGSAHHLAPHAARGGPLRAVMPVRDLRWHGRDDAIRG